MRVGAADCTRMSNAGLHLLAVILHQHEQGKARRDAPPPAGDIPAPVANVTEWLQASLHTPLTPRQLYDRQRLFSIYLHRSPDAKHEWEPSSIFYGRDIADRSIPRPSAKTFSCDMPQCNPWHRPPRLALHDPVRPMKLRLAGLPSMSWC